MPNILPAVPYKVPFILREDFCKVLANLRKEYEKNAHKDLSKDSQPNSVFIFFGAKDISTRNKQITFIEKIQKALVNKFFDAKGNLSLNSEEEVNDYFLGLRILVAAIFYLKSKLPEPYWGIRSPDNNSVLFKLLDDALALGKGNVMDEATRNCVLTTTRDYIHRGPSKILDKDLYALTTDPEWIKFTKFINTQCDTLGIAPQKYPITAFLMPIFGKPFELAGYTIGWTLGEVFARSTSSQSIRINLIPVLSGLLLFLSGGEASMTFGVSLITPIYAGLLLERYSSLTLAWLFGATLSWLGKGTGWMVGMPLDITYQVARHALASLHSKDSKLIPHISGFNLMNGDYYFNGVKIPSLEKTDVQNTLARMKSIRLEPTPEGLKISVGDDGKDEAIIPYGPTDLPMPEEQQVLLKELAAAMTEQGFLPTEQAFMPEEAQEAKEAQEVKEVKEASDEPMRLAYA